MHVAWLNQAPFEQTIDGSLTTDLASARYRCLIPAQELKALGVTSAIVGNLVNADSNAFAQEFPKAKADVAIVGKFFKANALDQAQIAKQSGCRVIADFCDFHFHKPDVGPLHRAMVAMADTVVASTPIMAEAIRQVTGVQAFVVPDPYEGRHGEPRFAPAPDKLKLLWFGSPTNLDTLVPALPKLVDYAHTTKALSLTIVTSITPDLQGFFKADHEGQGSFGKALRALQSPQFEVHVVPWSLSQLASELEACDAVIIPSLPNETKLVKGANRLIEALWAGRPVVAYPLPSYREFASCCWLDEDILIGLKQLQVSPEETLERVKLGQKMIAQNYAPAVVAEKWKTILDQPGQQTAPIPTTAHSLSGALANPVAASSTSPIRLNLGCGDKILPGFVNVDVAASRAGKKPDLLCDLRKLTLPDNYADEAMAIHVVEHFYHWEIHDILREWHRVLKPGGKIILECPNLISACTEFLKNPDLAAMPGQEGRQTMWVLYGDPAWKDPLMCHRWGYTPQSLGRTLMDAGFIHVRQEPAQYKMKEPRDMRVVGEKPKPGAL